MRRVLLILVIFLLGAVTWLPFAFFGLSNGDQLAGYLTGVMVTIFLSFREE